MARGPTLRTAGVLQVPVQSVFLGTNHGRALLHEDDSTIYVFPASAFARKNLEFVGPNDRVIAKRTYIAIVEALYLSTGPE